MRKKSKKPLTWGYLPVNLPAQTFRTILSNSGLENRVLIFYKVIFNSYRRKYNDKFSYLDFVPIHSHLVEKILGENKAADAIKFLTQNGLLQMQVHKHSQPDPRNNKTRSFRIPIELLNIDLFGGNNRYYKKIAVFDKKAYNAEVGYRKERHKRFVQSSQYPVLARLVEALKDAYLLLHTQEARQIIRDNRLDVKKNGYSYLEYLYQVNSRDIEWYHRDGYGRIHFAFLSLMKVCHPLVRFDGYDQHRCKEVDIKNSQAFLSSIISFEVVERMLPEGALLVKDIDFDTAGWDEYRELCLSGRIYEVWAEQLEQYFGTDWKHALMRYEEGKNARRKKKKKSFDFLAATNREAAKKVFFYVIFGTQSTGDEVSNCFQERFPDVWQGFKAIKSRYCNFNPSDKNKSGKGSYTNLMWMMQRIESEIVVNTCVKNLLDLGVTQIIPRHDSILTPEPLAEQVRTELIQAFEYRQLPIPIIR